MGAEKRIRGSVIKIEWSDIIFQLYFFVLGGLLYLFCVMLLDSMFGEVYVMTRRTIGIIVVVSIVTWPAIAIIWRHSIVWSNKLYWTKFVLMAVCAALGAVAADLVIIHSAL
jgi:hypothetical protein